MNPRKKGWLKEYLDFRKLLIVKDQVKEATAHSRHPEHSIYRLVQPSGLMYGKPLSIGSLEENEYDDWNQNDKMKVLLAESLLNGSRMLEQSKSDDPEEISKALHKTLLKISSFYNKVYPELSTSSTNFFGKKKSPITVVEQIIEKRVLATGKGDGNFWLDFFSNSLFFLDVYFFGQWMHTDSEQLVSELMKDEKDKLRFDIIKILAAAAHANKIVEIEEERLFEFFLKAAKLSTERSAAAREILATGIGIGDLNIPNSWILKKFFLELSILTVWSDKKVEDAEVVFLEKLTMHFGFYEEDLENSMLAIEGFVLEHWQELGDLQNKFDLKNIGDRYVARMAKIAEKSKRKIDQEIKGSKEVMSMLAQFHRDGLSVAESQYLKDKLYAILKSLPSFVLISMPSKYLSLPILLKILPQDILEPHR